MDNVVFVTAARRGGTKQHMAGGHSLGCVPRLLPATLPFGSACEQLYRSCRNGGQGCFNA